MHSLSTRKSPTKQIFIGIYSEDILLCPYSALEVLLTKTQPWRDSTDKQRYMFLTTITPHTPAAVDTIANWIKSIIRISSPTSSAKDMRTMAAFFLQNAGTNLSSILVLGNWFSNSVYQRFYQRGIKLMLECN